MGILALSAILSGCGGGTAATMTATVNVAPTANPGASQNVLVGTVVNMDGSASKDPDGGTLTFKWTLIGKPIGSAFSPTFKADVEGVFVASLIVNDGKVDSTTSTVPISSVLMISGLTGLSGF